ncbi:hypothetical protein LG943_15225 [Streptomonospora sp. S1-112]|uniref:Uncharacterized protein n=1 Tax=Streptomonospora mangrovi TaxID=2883123 RepID=A0A9X3NLT9_9ACTN|nr:hypothetical protein [Streptomonospora mangrovi]MDA0565658.1 hypothetical protein [Streptomonospora mangrovi]
MSGEARAVWAEVEARSGGFEEQVLLESPFATVPVDLGDAVALVGALAADSDHARVLRMLDVTVEGRRSAALKAAVLADPPGPDERVEDWGKRVFAGRTFSVMVNAAERWSEPVARAAAELFAPAREAFGIPQHLYRVSLFMGDYGFTPSGVHRDVGRDERVLHLNVGPGRKTFHSWPVETYRRLTGTTRATFDPDPLLPHADTHEMRPGDLLMLNVSRYHVGHSAELSATFGFEMSKMTAREVVREAAAAALGEVLDAGADPVGRGPGFAPVPVDYTDLDWAGLPAARLDAWLADAVETYTARQRSNAGLSLSPVPLPEVDAAALAAGAVRLAAPFPLVVREHADRCDVYVRGRRVTVPRADALLGLVERLSTGEEAATADLLPTEERERRLVLRLLTQLTRLRGVDAVPPAAAAPA